MLKTVRGFFGMDDEDAEQEVSPPHALDLQWVMSDQRGRRHVWRLIQVAGVYRLSYTGEPNSTAFNEGQRNAGLRLLDEITTHCPQEYHLMVTENQE